MLFGQNISHKTIMHCLACILLLFQFSASVSAQDKEAGNAADKATGKLDPSKMTLEQLEVAIAATAKNGKFKPLEIALGTKSYGSTESLIKVLIDVPKFTKFEISRFGMRLSNGFRDGFEMNLHCIKTASRLEQIRRDNLSNDVTYLFKTKEFHIWKDVHVDSRTGKTTNYYRFAMKKTIHHVDCVFEHSLGEAQPFEDLLLMIASARSARPKEPAPKYPVEALKFYKWNLKENEGKLTYIEDSEFACDSMFALLPRAKGLQDVQWLNLRNENMTDEGLKCLAGFKNLERLNVHSGGVTGTGLRHLVRLKKLKALGTSMSGINDEGLKSVALLSNLEELTLPGQFITDDGFKPLARLRSLRLLWITWTGLDEFSGHGLAHLSKLPKLEKIYLSNMPVTDEGLREFKRAPALRELNLSETKVYGRELTNLANFPELRKVSLSDTPIIDLTGIAMIPKLESLSLLDTKVDDEQVAKLAKCKMLKTLYLRNTRVSDKSIVEIAKLPLLEYIGLENTLVTDKAVEALAKAPKLKSLDLSRTAITDKSVEIIQSMKSLTRVTLKNTRASSGAIEALKKARPKLDVSE